MQDKPEETKLRNTFIEMLFALTVAEIATKFAEFINSPVSIIFWPAYTHLFLATGLVTTSWVGWHKSNSPGNHRDVDKIFSWPFLLLLIDIGLVICYFIIVKGVEKIENVQSSLENPSVVHEAFWLMITFIGYILWDFISNVCIGKPNGRLPCLDKLRQEYSLKNDSLITIICFVFIVVFCFFCYLQKPSNVVLADIVLLLFIFLFRFLKQYRCSRSGLAFIFSALLVVLAILCFK